MGWRGEDSLGGLGSGKQRSWVARPAGSDEARRSSLAVVHGKGAECCRSGVESSVEWGDSVQSETLGKTKCGRLLGEAGDKDKPRAWGEGISTIEIKINLFRCSSG